MLDTILTIGAGILSGGATGILGVGLQSLFTWLNKKADHAHDLKVREMDLKITQAEGDNAVRIADAHARIAQEEGDAAVHRESYRMEPKRFATGDRPDGWIGRVGWLLLVLTDVVRGSVRPGLTLYLTWLVSRLYEQSDAIVRQVGAEVLAAMAVDVHKQIVFTLCYLFTTCVTWWFGTRMRHHPPAPAKAST